MLSKILVFNLSYEQFTKSPQETQKERFSEKEKVVSKQPEDKCIEVEENIEIAIQPKSHYSFTSSPVK
jgi:hypothetical protein